jgi:hypothetical protein
LSDENIELDDEKLKKFMRTNTENLKICLIQYSKFSSKILDMKERDRKERRKRGLEYMMM